MEPKKSFSYYFELLLGLSLVGVTVWLIISGQENLKKCSNNITPENCNKPAGDFAVEIDNTSNITLQNCPPNNSGPCIFNNIENLSQAIILCNQYPNICNRFIYEKDTVKFVPLAGSNVYSPGKNTYVRQNGVTYQGIGSGATVPTNSDPGSYVPTTQAEPDSGVTTSFLTTGSGSNSVTSTVTSIGTGTGTGTGY